MNRFCFGNIFLNADVKAPNSSVSHITFAYFSFPAMYVQLVIIVRSFYGNLLKMLYRYKIGVKLVISSMFQDIF